jgi:hypothetical protein
VAQKEGEMRNNPEYQLYKQVSTYLRYMYPKVLYRFDMAGLNLSIAQAGMNKAIQHSKGYPDLFIAEPRANFHGLFIELKPEGTKLYKRDGYPLTPHIAEQIECLNQLDSRGYAVGFGIGFENTTKIITNYLNLKP